MPYSLYRYLLSSVIIPFLGIIIFLVSLLLIFQLARVLNLLSGQGLSIMDLTQFFGSIAMSFLPLVVPLSIFFSVLYGFYKLSGESEFVAMRALGLGNVKLLAPVLFFGLMSALSLYLLNQQGIPRAKKYFAVKMGEMRSNQFFSQLKSGQFFTEMKDVILFAERFDSESLKMENVFVQIQSQNNLKRIIMSDSGRFFWDEEQGSRVLKVEFFDGNLNSLSPGDQLDKTLFETYQYPVLQEDILIDESHRANAMTHEELQKYLSLSDKELKKMGGSPAYRLRALVEYWDRINTPFLCLLYTLIGLCLGIGHFRSRGKNVAFWAISILMGYFSMYFFFVGLARKGSIEPFLAVFVPSFALLFFSLLLVRKINWLS